MTGLGQRRCPPCFRGGGAGAVVRGGFALIAAQRAGGAELRSGGPTASAGPGPPRGRACGNGRRAASPRLPALARWGGRKASL